MLVLFTVLRLIFPLVILKRPLLGALLAVFLDCLDWTFVPHDSGYQAWDKLLDVYYLSLEAFVSLRFASKMVRNTAILLFLVRLNGVIVFFTAGSKIPLFLFPNIFESFFVFCLLYEYFAKKRFVPSRAQLTAALAAIAIPKVIQEYAFHVNYTFPWDYAGIFAKTPGIMHEIVDKGLWIAVYLSLPAYILYRMVKHGREVGS
mgnify:CR=1 FL=1